jgi:hypothetical protein
MALGEHYVSPDCRGTKYPAIPSWSLSQHQQLRCLMISNKNSKFLSAIIELQSLTWPSVTAAAVAGTAMYLDAKHGIRQDLRGIRTVRSITKIYTEAGKITLIFPPGAPLLNLNC